MLGGPKGTNSAVIDQQPQTWHHSELGTLPDLRYLVRVLQIQWLLQPQASPRSALRGPSGAYASSLQLLCRLRSTDASRWPFLELSEVLAPKSSV